MGKILRIRRALVVGIAPSGNSDPARPVLGGRSGERLCRLLELPPADVEKYLAFANLTDERLRAAASRPCTSSRRRCSALSPATSPSAST